jgi:glycosyltransferase involved in cell wall biosynthesis
MPGYDERFGREGVLLHPDLLDGRTGAALQLQANDAGLLALGAESTSVSVLVRAHNDEDCIEGLFKDIARQDRDGLDDVQVVVVDVGSTDRTRYVAHDYGADLIEIHPSEYNHAHALNRGLEQVFYPTVFSTVGHAALSNNQVLRTAVRHATAEPEKFGGAYGVVLPNANASRWERAGAVLLGAQRKVRGGPAIMKAGAMGLMAADCSVIRAEEQDGAVTEYNEKWGHGGADGALGNAVIKSGKTVTFDPLLSVHHTHGFGPVATARQYQQWLRMAKPHDFNLEDWASWHPNMGL